MYNFVIKMNEIRKKKGISQKELAKKLSTTQQQVSKYEQYIDLPSLPRLVEIAQILDVTLDELVEFKQMHHEYSQELKNKIK